MLYAHRKCKLVINLITYTTRQFRIVWPSVFGFLPKTCGPNEASSVFPCYSKSTALTEHDLQMRNGSCTRVKGEQMKVAFHF